MPLPQRHVHTLDPEQFQAIINAFTNTFEPATPQPEPLPAPNVVPWTFRDPRQQCEVAAYLDPQNQVRHVPVSRATDVPKTWRPLLLPG
jgi:hypothetical protein